MCDEEKILQLSKYAILMRVGKYIANLKEKAIVEDQDLIVTIPLIELKEEIMELCRQNGVSSWLCKKYFEKHLKSIQDAVRRSISAFTSIETINNVYIPQEDGIIDRTTIKLFKVYNLFSLGFQESRCDQILNEIRVHLKNIKKVMHEN